MSEPMSDEPNDAEKGIFGAGDLAINEALRAIAKFLPFNSSHEGYAVLAEEVDEMWDAIKANDLEAAREEAIHVAATALRYIAEAPTTKERDKRKPSHGKQSDK